MLSKALFQRSVNSVRLVSSKQTLTRLVQQQSNTRMIMSAACRGFSVSTASVEKSI